VTEKGKHGFLPYRIRGKVGTGDHDGKWYFQMWMTEMGQGDPTDEDLLGTFGPWDSEQEAHQKLREASKVAADRLVEIHGKEPTGSYLDMKTNLLRRWDRKDEN
jgi:hypothetical protein